MLYAVSLQPEFRRQLGGEPVLVSTLPEASVQAASRYERWNSVIAHRFYDSRMGRAQRPVHLRIDEEILRELAPQIVVDPVDAVTDFVKVVRSQVPAKQRYSLWPIEKPIRRWLSSDTVPRDVPPFVGVLALCVLAASQMERWDYYGPLNALLDYDGEGCPPGYSRFEQY